MSSDFVYAGFTQADLDAQYNNRARFPDYEKHFESWTRWSEATRKKIPCDLDIAVGKSKFERIDIFPAASAKAPVYVFIKGGYWYSLDKCHYSYVAEGMRPHGITTVTNNFGLAPDHDMDTIVQHNRSALIWLWRNADQIGVDMNQLYIGGHSAGGHLGMVLLGTDWPSIDPSLPRNLVKGVCSIGGLHDLEPIRKSFLNQKLHITAEQARRHSPVRLDYRFPAPLLLITAVDESPELHRQSRIMKAAWENFGYPVEMIIPPDLDHFSVVNNLGDPNCPLVISQLEQMRLAFAA
ncbi:MAG: alpha/beta hydrolase [Woeseia sp.]